MLKVIFEFGEGAEGLLGMGVPLFKIEELSVFAEIKRMGEEIGNEDIDKFDEISSKMEKEFTVLRDEYA